MGVCCPWDERRQKLIGQQQQTLEVILVRLGFAIFYVLKVIELVEWKVVVLFFV